MGDGRENLIPYVKGQSGNPSGKRKYIFTQADVSHLFQLYAKKTPEQLQEIIDDKKATADELTVARLWLKNSKNPNVSEITMMFDRAVGKVVEVVEQKSTHHDGDKVRLIPSELLEEVRIRMIEEGGK